MNFWFLILLLFIGPGTTMAEDRANFVVKGKTFFSQQQGVFNVGNFDHELTTDEMLQILQEQRYVAAIEYTMEYQKYSYWVMTIDNQNDQTTRIFIRYPLQMPLTKSWLYRDGKLQLFDHFPVAFDMYYIDLPPGRSTIINMRLSGGDVRGRATSIQVYDSDSGISLVSMEQHVMGSIGGAVAIMIFYNLGMYFFIRRAYFLYYSIYSAAGAYCMAIFQGYLPWVLPHLGLGLAVSGVGLVLFSNSALSLREAQPRLYRLSLGFLGYLLIFSIAIVLQPKWNYIAFSMPLALLFCIYVSIRRALDGFRPAIYLVLGWCALMTAASISVLNVAVIGSSFWGNLGPYGFALEVCFFSFAIGQKARLSEQQAHRESEHAFNQLKKVFYPHQIQQIKSGVELETTMPTGKGEAAVISFDIVESSRIQQRRAKEFIEDSIKSCVSIISEGYDPEQLRANGYRIKEVGDGFLCSVGYPFQVPNDIPAALCAVKLSLRFIQIFQQQVNQLRDHAPVYCSVGIAYDALEGYFPKVGTIEYDVYGRAVILATRYEAFRRQLFPEGVSGHILTLHEKIFDQLPPDIQADFQVLDLQRAHLVVRDDLGATRLYFRVIQPSELQDKEQKAS